MRKRGEAKVLIPLGWYTVSSMRRAVLSVVPPSLFN